MTVEGELSLIAESLSSEASQLESPPTVLESMMVEDVCAFLRDHVKLPACFCEAFEGKMG